MVRFRGTLAGIGALALIAPLPAAAEARPPTPTAHVWLTTPDR